MGGPCHSHEYQDPWLPSRTLYCNKMINDHDIYFTWRSFSTTIPLMFCRTSSSDWHKCSASGLINRCPFNLSYHGNPLLPVQALKKVLIEAQECVVLFSVLAGCYTDPAPYWSLIPAELCYSHIFLNSTAKLCQIHQCSTARNNYFLTQTFKQAFQVRIRFVSLGIKVHPTLTHM